MLILRSWEMKRMSKEGKGIKTGAKKKTVKNSSSTNAVTGDLSILPPDMEKIVKDRDRQEKELKEKERRNNEMVAIIGVERVHMLGRIFIRVGNVYYDAFSIRKVKVTPAYLTFNVWMKKVTIPFSYGKGISYKDVRSEEHTS